MVTSRKNRSRRPVLENLEGRQLLSTVTLPVTSLADSGVGTLRAQITTANSGLSTDNYVIPIEAKGVISLKSLLPALTRNISIIGPGKITDPTVAYSQSANALATSLYSDVLGRAPDQAGLASVASSINAGTSMSNVVGSFWNSSKQGANPIGNLNTATVDASNAFVNALYQDVLGRPADQSGLAYWTQVLENNQASPSQLDVAFWNCPEHLAPSNVTITGNSGPLFDVSASQTVSIDGITVNGNGNQAIQNAGSLTLDNDVFVNCASVQSGQTATVSYVVDVQNGSLPQFNPALGTLNSVSYFGTLTEIGEANFGVVESAVDVSYVGTPQLNVNGTSIANGPTISGSLKSGEGQWCMFTAGQWNANGIVSNVSPFVGTGAIPVSAGWNANIGANYVMTPSSWMLGNITFTYAYTTPETRSPAVDNSGTAIVINSKFVDNGINNGSADIAGPGTLSYIN